MTKLKSAALAIVAFLCFEAQAQFSFGVSPGLSLNTAYAGYRINEKVMPYVAFQFYNVKLNMVESGQRNNPMTGTIENYEETDLAKLNLIIPTVGVKYYAIQRDDLGGYFNVNFSKPLLFGKAEVNGTSDPDFEEQIDNISFWGGEVGFGTEYYFSDAFSVGGEFGIRWMRVNDESTSTSTIFDPNTGNLQEAEQTNDIAVNVNPTYARISFNFYFN